MKIPSESQELELYGMLSEGVLFECERVMNVDANSNAERLRISNCAAVVIL